MPCQPLLDNMPFRGLLVGGLDARARTGILVPEVESKGMAFLPPLL